MMLLLLKNLLIIILKKAGNMFKVLIIAYYFPPMGLSGVQRVLKFAKYMKQYNWEPTIITADKTAYFAYDESLLEDAKDMRVIRTAGKDPNSRMAKAGAIKMPSEIIRKTFNRVSQTFFIPDNKKGWATQAKKTAQELLSKEQFDIIFVSGPPFSSFIIAAELKKEFNIPLFVDYRDLWLDNQFSFYPTPLHRTANKKKEYRVLKAADKVIATNRKIKEFLLKTYKFLTFEDVIIIPHGYDPADFQSADFKPKMNKKLILTYSGIFYDFITPKFFFEAFKKLQFERPDIAENFELHFVGHLNSTNLALVNKMGLLKYVKNHGYMTHTEAVKKIMASDVLWAMIGKKKNADTIALSKLFEYFASKKPIIACVPDGASKTAAIDYGASFVVDPEDIDAIKETLLKVHQLYKEGKLPTPNEEFIQRHNREILTEQLTKHFQFYIRTE